MRTYAEERQLQTGPPRQATLHYLPMLQHVSRLKSTPLANRNLPTNRKAQVQPGYNSSTYVSELHLTTNFRIYSHYMLLCNILFLVSWAKE